MGNRRRSTRRRRRTPAVSPPFLASTSTSGTDFDGLPPEIVEKLEDKQDLLNCRLVSSTVKKCADYVLERRALAEWTKWVPTESRKMDSIAPPCPIWNRAIEMEATIRLFPTWSRESYPLVVSFHHCLPETENEKLGNSFPTNFLRTRMHDRVWPRGFTMPSRVRMLKEFMFTYAHSFSYLSTLLIVDIELTPVDLVTILGHVGNLKALTLENIELLPQESVQEDGENIVLPPLPKLTYLRVTSGEGNDASKLLLSAYHQELTTLETHWAPRFATPYKKLECLKLIIDLEPHSQFYGAEFNFPSLNHLSVIIHKGHTFSWSDLSKSIDSFPKTLVSLHLDVNIQEEREGEDIDELKPSGVTFPSLLAHGIFRPTKSKHAEFLQRVIFPKFTKLECLKLENCCYISRRPYSPTIDELYNVRHRELMEEEESADVAGMVRDIQFWTQVCPSLRKIDLI